jgi:sulfur carrier protein
VSTTHDGFHAGTTPESIAPEAHERRARPPARRKDCGGGGEAARFDVRVRALLCHARMQVRLNGEIRDVPDGTTVAGLLLHLGVKAQRVAVEVNETVVTKDRYEALRLGPGDSIEIVAFVGGG